MLEALIISQVLLWIVLIAIAAVQFALLRQIGVLHERIAPIGALTIDHGPKEGENAPRFDLTDLGGRAVSVGAPDQSGHSTLLFFLSPTCPVCKKMLPVLKSLARSEEKDLRIVLASDGEREEHERFFESQRLSEFPYLLSQEMGLRYRIGRLPYAVLIDPDGVIRAKGLINTREHLESLLEAKERRVASIQQYFEAERRAGSRDA